jgi:hypothetical protein
VRQFVLIAALVPLAGCGNPAIQEIDVGVLDVGEPGAIYVNWGAQPGGDGSAGAPFANWADAADTAGEAGWFIFAPGEYDLSSPHSFDSLVLDGAGVGRTFLTGFATEVSESLSVNEADLVDAGELAVPSVELSASNISGAAGIDASDARLDAVDYVDAPALIRAATLTMTNVCATGSDLTFEVSENATIDGLDVSETVGPAVTFTGEGTWEVNDLEITDIGQELTGPAGDGGVCWVVDATTGVATDVSLIRCAARGLAARENAVVEINEGVVAGIGNTAVSSQRGADVRLVDVEVSDASILLFVTGASLNAQRVLGQRSRNAAVMVGSESNLTLLDSTFLEAPSGHISLSGPGTTALIQGNLFDGAEFDPCIRMGTNELSVTINENTLRGCGQNGISLGSGSGFVVTNNEISGVTLIDGVPELADGVSVIRADVVLTGNTISDVEGAGIVFLTSTGTVASNIIEGPARAGITLVESGEGELTVTENQVSDAVGVGIAVLTSNANVVNNTVVRTIVSFEDGLGDGILFASGSSGLIVGNDVRDSAYNGIRFVDGVTATIEGNRVSGSGLAAIHQDCGPYEPSQVTIGDNELEGEVSLCD